LKQVEKGVTIRITRHGRPIGVIVDPSEYERLRQVQAYLQMINLSRALYDSDLIAADLYRISRADLESRA
jgi:prevent-host-death family protein